MKHEYELFEKFADGSSLWRDSVYGDKIARSRLVELAQESENRFYALDLSTGQILGLGSGADAPGLLVPFKAEKRSKSHVA